MASILAFCCVVSSECVDRDELKSNTFAVRNDILSTSIGNKHSDGVHMSASVVSSVLTGLVKK